MSDMIVIPVPYSTPRGERWKVDFQVKNPQGIPVRVQKRAFLSRHEAEAWADREYHELRLGLKEHVKKGSPGPVAKPKTTGEAVATIVDLWLRRGTIKDSTAGVYRSCLRLALMPAIGVIPWQKLRLEDIGCLLDHYATAKAPIPLVVLKRAMQDSTKLGIPGPRFDFEIKKNYSKPKDRIISLEDLDTLCMFSPPKWAAVWKILYYTGMRIGELQALDWLDWSQNLRDLSVHVRCTLANTDRGFIRQTPKSGRDRHVYLCREAELAFRDLLVQVRGVHGIPTKDATFEERIMLRNPKTGSFTPYFSVTTALRVACQRAGIPVFGPHVFRHSFASALVAAGVDIYTVSTHLGHGSVAVTQRYCKIPEATLRSSVKVLDSLRKQTPPIDYE